MFSVSSYFTSRQVVGMTGVSYRQLDCWTRRGILAPIYVDRTGARRSGGSGTARRFGAADVEKVRRIKALLTEGFAWWKVDELLSLSDAS
jgi:DNA-binding transcriptional MerR regulator